MILSLNNIGKVENAIVELKGITVIAGENNTGKSTVGKALFGIFNSFYRIEDQIQRERLETVERLLEPLYYNSAGKTAGWIDMQEIARMIVDHAAKYRNDPELLKKDIYDMFAQNDPTFHEGDDGAEELKRLNHVLAVSDEDIMGSVLSKKLAAEFEGQINNIFTEKSGQISLKIRNRTVSIAVEDHAVQTVSGSFSLNTEVLYLDDPFVIDGPFINDVPFVRRTQMAAWFYPNTSYVNHRSHLQRKLIGGRADGNIINEIIATRKLDHIYEKLNSICSGEMTRSKRSGFVYQRAGSDKVLAAKNISTGLKTFVILKTLLQNGSLEENGTLILDEPEIHLHPEWQVLFAELIVLIQKEFHMHILLNTHSPYFLNAIEVYAAKHRIADRCSYYMAFLDGDLSRIEDVSNNIEVIYRRLARPLQELENVRWQDHD